MLLDKRTSGYHVVVQKKDIWFRRELEAAIASCGWSAFHLVDDAAPERVLAHSKRLVKGVGAIDDDYDLEALGWVRLLAQRVEHAEQRSGSPMGRRDDAETQPGRAH